MPQVSRLAALTMMLFAAACTTDRASAPVTGPDGTPVKRATATTTETTPVSMTIFPNEVVGGTTASASGRVEVADTAVNFDRYMQVTSNNPSVLPFLSTGTVVAAGTTFAGVTVDPTTVSQRTVVTVFVTGNGVTVSADLIVDPPGTTIAPTLSSFTVNPGTVNAGTTATGTIAIPSPAPAGGVVVSLGSRIPASASLPASVTVPQGATTASFPIATFAGFPNSTTSVLLEANTANTLIQSAITVVTGATTTATPSLFSLTLGSPSVVGGTSTVGTVALTAAAPSGGAVVSLSSTNSSVAATPSSVTVPAGASSASFTITTKAVSATTTVNISAAFGGGTLTTALTVNASSTSTTSTSLSAPTLLAPAADQKFAPGANVTFDWSDVANAGSYEIQVDDRDTFPSPLILGQIVAASQLSTSALPTSTMFWRVRAISASGAAGSWSSVRRFEIKQ